MRAREAAIAPILVVAMLAVGIGMLANAGLRYHRHQLATGPSGPTAGGAATAADMCRRGTPPDVAAACLGALERMDAAERATDLRWAVSGGVCLLVGALFLLATRRRKSSEGPRS